VNVTRFDGGVGPGGAAPLSNDGVDVAVAGAEGGAVRTDVGAAIGVAMGTGVVAPTGVANGPGVGAAMGAGAVCALAAEAAIARTSAKAASDFIMVRTGSHTAATTGCWRS
jgi:hypothetical protein